MRKKGQAAMEFLMTYGWAIIAAVIVVGVLWYMIGNPANLAGNNFQVSAPLAANAMALDASANTVQIEVRNGLAESITVTAIGIGTLCSSTPSASMPAGNLTAFTISTCTMASGDRVNEDVTISYTTSGSSVTQQATGSISGRVP